MSSDVLRYAKASPTLHPTPHSKHEDKRERGRARVVVVNTSEKRAVVLSFSRPEDGGRGE